MRIDIDLFKRKTLTFKNILTRIYELLSNDPPLADLLIWDPLFLFLNYNYIAKKLRVNQQIRAPKVLLIEGDEKLGVMSVEEALQRAEQKELDLVEVSPFSDPPVCKIMDYGNYLYNLKKKSKKQKKKAKKTEIKTIRLSIRTDKHDLDVKAKQAKKFLENRNLIKVVLIFRGREISHQDLGREKMQTFYQMLEDVCAMEEEPRRQGFQMIMILTPLK